MSAFARYASDPVSSRGRVYDTEESPTRSDFQRDRDRIIHSTAFRRLQHKTQVFLRHEGLHFRTRLTHTLEVSQIARSIARALSLNEDLAEAIALAHDLGHPPFGHAGERVLDHKMRRFGGFDHNMQALRVVSLLENRYAEHDGLNLTWETLEGLIKHNGPLIDDRGKPVGRYAQHGLPDGYDQVPAADDLMLSSHAGLEAQVAAVADDIAYNAHDVDDAIRAGLIVADDMRNLRMAGAVVREVHDRWPDLAPSRQTHEIQRRLITRAVEDVISHSRELLSAAHPSTADAARHAGKLLVDFSPGMARDASELKTFLWERVYRSEQVMGPVRDGETVVARIFDYLLVSADMPGRWGEGARRAQTEAERARVVCDFVAGMTDPYALDLHQRLFDARPDFG